MADRPYWELDLYHLVRVCRGRCQRVCPRLVIAGIVPPAIYGRPSHTIIEATTRCKHLPPPGISLVVKEYRGTEWLVVFYTRGRGKVEAVAWGIGIMTILVETVEKVFYGWLAQERACNCQV